MAARKITVIILSVLATMIFLFVGTVHGQRLRTIKIKAMICHRSWFLVSRPTFSMDIPLSQYPQDIIESIPFVDSARVCTLDESGNMLLGKNAHEKCKAPRRVASPPPCQHRRRTALASRPYPLHRRTCAR